MTTDQKATISPDERKRLYHEMVEKRAQLSSLREDILKSHHEEPVKKHIGVIWTHLFLLWSLRCTVASRSGYTASGRQSLLFENWKFLWADEPLVTFLRTFRLNHAWLTQRLSCKGQCAPTGEYLGVPDGKEPLHLALFRSHPSVRTGVCMAFKLPKVLLEKFDAGHCEFLKRLGFVSGGFFFGSNGNPTL